MFQSRLFSLLLLVSLLVFAHCKSTKELPPTCESPVYCSGPLLHTVQMSRIFNDSKTFVDMKMVNSEAITLENFNAMMSETNGNPTPEQIAEFVHKNFVDGQELENWVPPDFNPEPEFLQRIADPALRKFGTKVVSLWKTLARKVKPEVFQNPEQYSIIPVTNGFIIPGGRFRELYYWDTYWIIRGLLISEMPETARGMIENLMELVKKLGHVPNGSRVYYQQRSQPPLLTKMTYQYYQYTSNTTWLKDHIHILEQELEYWEQHRRVIVHRNGYPYQLYQYNAPSQGPRPESYREDVTTASQTPDPNNTYIQLKSGAESGWDFSSRWLFDSEGGNNANLTGINTTRLIPVDLNAYLYDASKLLSKLYFHLGDSYKSAKWYLKADYQKIAINYVLWNENAGIWQDYDLELNQHRDYFYVSNLTPLWVGLGNGTEHQIIEYLKKENVTNFLGGTPTSILRTGEQWDLPNAWPPLQAILVQGLNRLRRNETSEIAQSLAEHWVRANFIGYSHTDEMFEKYDAEVPGQYGGGGEYVVQAGFGWTNGVLLEFLNDYGDKLKS